MRGVGASLPRRRAKGEATADAPDPEAEVMLVVPPQDDRVDLQSLDREIAVRLRNAQAPES